MIRILFLVLALLAAPLPVAADQADPRLDILFKALKEAPSLADALAVENTIWTIWLESDRDGVSRLLEDGMVAMSHGAYGPAIEAFSGAIRQAPDFAEAWNKRATAYYLLGEFEASVRDIQRTLALEPRHFGALSGLGLIYLAIDNDSGARKAYEKALEIHPLMPGVKAQLQRLKDRIGGKAI